MASTFKDHQEIGLNIARLRDQRGMAQVDLAEELGISKNSVGAIERGETDFRISTLISACDAFDVSPSEILPDRLKPESSLDRDMQKLADKLSGLTPYQRSQCLNAIFGIVDAFSNAVK